MRNHSSRSSETPWPERRRGRARERGQTLTLFLLIFVTLTLIGVVVKAIPPWGGLVEIPVWTGEWGDMTRWITVTH